MQLNVSAMAKEELPQGKNDRLIRPQFRDVRLDTYWHSSCSIPRDVLQMGLKPTTVIIYGLLLMRAALSRKNHWADKSGRVFVYYTIEELSRDSCRGTTTVKSSLNELTQAGLISRMRTGFNRLNRIFVRIPVEAVEEANRTDGCPSGNEAGQEACPMDGQKSDHQKVKGPSPNPEEKEKDKSRKAQDENDPYDWRNINF